MKLPNGWDFGRDLAVLVGTGGDELLEKLAQHGQARLFVYRANGEAPAAGQLVRSPSELLVALLSMQGVQPQHVAVHRVDGSDVTSDEQRELAHAVEEGLRSRALQALTIAKSGPKWLLQSIGNLPELARHPSIEPLAGAFAGRPCVIVSPGPSLARNVEQLAAVRDRVVVMTCTHALHALARAGAPPNLVVVADAIDLRRHYDGFDIDSIDALVVGASCDTGSFEQRAPRHLTFAGNGPVDDWIYRGLGEGSSALSTGGSVACSELSLALHLGCDPILFVGQDLAFTDGRFYADGSLDGDARVETNADGSFHLVKPEGSEDHTERKHDGKLWFTREQETVEVPAWSGGTVGTSMSFAAYLVWFSALARSIDPAGGPRLFNCTEGGARIEGMQHVPLAEALAELDVEPLDVGARLDEVFATFDAGERRGRLVDEVRGMIAALEPCATLARDCGRLAGKARRDARMADRLKARERELSAALKPVRLLSIVAQDDIVRAQENARTATNVDENLAAAKALFGVVERGVQLLRTPLERALAELERG